MRYHFQVDRGGQARTVKGALAKQKVKRELHGLAITVQGDRTVEQLAAVAPASDVNVIAWWKDVRRGQQTIYGTLFRFIDIAIRLRTPREVLMKIPEVLTWYIADATEHYESTPPRHPPAALRRVA